MRTLPAAAIPEGSTVRIHTPDDYEYEGGGTYQFTIKKIENATPRPGLITWINDEDLEEVVRAHEKYEVIELPD